MNDSRSVIWCSFFLFKQKTAYELRISDGSSDVCSSDLFATRENALRCVSPMSSVCIAFGFTAQRLFLREIDDGAFSKLRFPEAYAKLGVHARGSCLHSWRWSNHRLSRPV